MSELTIKDVLNKAIEMEEAGKIFYEYAASIVEDKEIREVLSVLAREEVGHKHIFENMKEEVKEIKQSDDINEYLKYLNSFLNTKSVFDRKKIESYNDKNTNITDIIDFAMDREQDTILYYMTLMTVVREEQNFLVQKIIDEERKHFIKLNQAKKLIEKK
ncbi:MAG: ferritin family protein [Candidatus Goldbacteria bacterium]|nr:ferritin family protein [Candidatus Goldiibacteriota bacterium]